MCLSLPHTCVPATSTLVCGRCIASTAPHNITSEETPYRLRHDNDFNTIQGCQAARGGPPSMRNCQPPHIYPLGQLRTKENSSAQTNQFGSSRSSSASKWSRIQVACVLRGYLNKDSWFRAQLWKKGKSLYHAVHRREASEQPMLCLLYTSPSPRD